MSTTKIKVSNIASVTGTGNVVLSANPTFTGTTATANISYTGTLTGSTGILNIGSGQLYKDASGNVGIGTSNLSANTAVTIFNNGTALSGTGLLIRSGYPGYSGVVANILSLRDKDNTTDTFNIKTDGSLSLNRFSALGTYTNSLTVNASGNVGIGGTSNPSKTLDVNGTIGYTAQNVTTQTNYFNIGAAGSIGNATGSKMTFRRNYDNIELVTIDGSGNVGIGTSSPYSQLDVYSGIASPTTGEASGVGTIRITNGASALTSAGGLEFKNAGDSNGYGAKIQALNSGGSQLVFANRQASATWTERMRIDSSGRITTPSQPAFKAYASTSVSNYTTAGTKITAYDTTTFNIGGHYSTVNKRFTAPIAGVYMFAARAWAAVGNTTGAGINITVNGTGVIATVRIATSSGDYSTMNPFTEVYLNANDYVEVFTETCTATGQVHISQGEAYSGFTGYFLG